MTVVANFPLGMCESQVGNAGQTRRRSRRVYYWLRKDLKVPVRYSSTESISILKMKPYLTLECSRFLRVCSLSDQVPRNHPGKKQGSEPGRIEMRDRENLLEVYILEILQSLHQSEQVP